MILSLGSVFLDQNLAELVDCQNRDVPVKLLDRVVKDGTSGLIDFISITLSLFAALDAILFVFLHFLLDVEDLGFAFLEQTVAFGGLFFILFFDFFHRLIFLHVVSIELVSERRAEVRLSN